MIRKLFLVGALMLVILVGVTMSGCEKDSDVLEWNTELQQQIKQDYVSHFDDGRYRTVEEIIIHSYYGIYDCCVVLVISDNDDYPPIPIITYTVAGFTFTQANPGRAISVWHKGVFYDLVYAYNEGFLTQENVGEIFELHNK